jgi:hypothetical protein
MEKLEETFEYQHPEKNCKVKARVEIDRQRHFLGFKDPTSGVTDCLILYFDDSRTTTSDLGKNKSGKVEIEKHSSREINVPVLNQTFSGEGSGIEALFKAYDEIHKYVEVTTGKKYGNGDTFVTIAPIGENREKISG